MEIVPIAHVESPYPTKFGVPRQPGLVKSLVSWLVADDERACNLMAGLRPGEFCWLVWAFSKNTGRGDRSVKGRGWSPTVRPPRLGGNQRAGVFATRSSFRPNALAISAVQVAKADDGSLAGQTGRLPLVGVDMVDGTPVYALRRYDRSRDCIPSASSGWLAEHEWPLLEEVVIPDEVDSVIPPNLRAGVKELLAQDPRPAYTRQTQPNREFWVPVDRYVIWFRVEGRTALVTRARRLGDAELRQLEEEGTVS